MGKVKIPKWKEMYATITVPKHSQLAKLFVEEVRKSKECVVHEMNHAIFEQPYRKYRRGKNRCKRCGHKTK